MKSQKLYTGIVVCAGLLSLSLYQLDGAQTTSLPKSEHTLTITGPVAVIRNIGTNVVLEFGGQWRRRFAITIDETNVLLSYRELTQQYVNKTIQVSGPVKESFGRFEIQITDLNQITILDPKTNAILQLPDQDEPMTATWFTNIHNLAKEIKKLQRDIKQLKQQISEQDKIISNLKSADKTRVEYHSYSRNDRDLEKRVQRIEAALDLAIKAERK